MELSDICLFYIHLCIPYRAILEILVRVHGICLSLSTLKRILRQKGIFRRKNLANILDVAMFIEEAISTSGGQQGYRWIHQICLNSGRVISRDVVQILLQILDPEGVEQRKRRRLRRRQYFSKGPDYLWHIDSYDKLKRYGLCINGCIDGFSRHVIWLNVYKTSSDPKVIAGYYMEAVDYQKGAPFMMRGDRGTENCYVSQMQTFLTNRESFIYGRSTGNQRIEMFWGFVRKECCQYWIELLGELTDNGEFTGDFVDINLVQFCFMKLLQKDLDRMVTAWNFHHIRKSKNQNSPNGRPEVMYTLPFTYNTHRYLTHVNQDQIDICNDECVFRDEYQCDRDIFELSIICLREQGWEIPDTKEEALDLYLKLRDLINSVL